MICRRRKIDNHRISSRHKNRFLNSPRPLQLSKIGSLQNDMSSMSRDLVATPDESTPLICSSTEQWLHIGSPGDSYEQANTTTERVALPAFKQIGQLGGKTHGHVLGL